MSIYFRLCVLVIAVIPVLTLIGCEKWSERTHEDWVTQPTGPVYDDTIIFAKIKSALVSDPDLTNINVEIKVKEGQVLLSGSADNKNQIDRAVMHSWIVDGVKQVDNQITLK